MAYIVDSSLKTSKNEIDVHKVTENYKDKTSIIISHKIWNIPELKVYFMSKGKIKK
jgi:hypothetical protein